MLDVDVDEREMRDERGCVSVSVSVVRMREAKICFFF